MTNDLSENACLYASTHTHTHRYKKECTHWYIELICAVRDEAL